MENQYGRKYLEPTFSILFLTEQDIIMLSGGSFDDGDVVNGDMHW